MSRAALFAAALVAGVAASSLPAAAQVDPDGMQRWLRVQNVSPVTIREFYMTDRDTNHWGDDRLGQHVVPPGTQMTVLPSPHQRMRGYCVFDMRVVFANNDAVEVRQVNLCTATALVCTSTSRCRTVH